MLGGVCGGLARYSGIDPLLWRVGFVALAFAGGTGVIVYLLLWLLMPAGPQEGPGEANTGWLHRQPERAPAGPRSPVPGVTIAGLLIITGVLVLLTNLTSWNISARGFLGAALLVVGLGLVAAAFTGGRRAKGGLIAIGLVLSLALIAVSSVPWTNGRHAFRGGVGDRSFHPATAADVRSVYSGGVGDMTVDLSGIDLAGLAGPIRTQVHHGVGDVTVLVPPSADVRVEAATGAGSVDLFGDGNGDGLYPGLGSASWTGDDRPEIVLSVDNGLGDLEVSRG
jgi:phage shock protein PspC (stress-responsive transcriptional regulator)